MAQSVANSMKPPPWLDSAVSKALFAEEDRQLIEQAGIDVARGGLTYVISRVVLALSLPMLALMLLQPTGVKALTYGFLAFGLGVMLPKWVVRSKAGKRRRQVVEELPLFMDLLRLLQGVGLSIDQSLQILATEFGSVLRVISTELALANRLYSSGRSREQSLQRLSTLGADDDMSAVVNLLVQVDRHGGAVQEPLKEFSIRLREKRQANFKEKIGAITVKMTGVMVLTLLPALIVITAGPGFIAVMQSLSSMGGK
ncbi:Bacterial type II secretion system protein F domain protein [compost metagenome]